MQTLIRLTSWAAVSLILALIIPSVTLAQESPPVEINLVADKLSYTQGEPIKMGITVTNTSGQDVTTRKGFMSQDFHLLITFTDPDNNPIRNKFLGVAQGEPGPSRIFIDQNEVSNNAVLAEVFPAVSPGNTVLNVIDDARDYYDLPKTGRYSAQVISSLETFPRYYTDSATGELLAYLDDPLRKNFDPLVSNKIFFDIVPIQPVVKSSIQVKVSLQQIGEGTKPRVSKSPLLNVPVHLIPRSRIPSTYFPINFKTYGIIYDNVEPLISSYTTLPSPNAKEGIAKFEVDPNDYVVIARYNQSQDFKHMGSQIDATDPRWTSGQPIVVNLMVMEKANGKKVPGKTTKKTGSELLITEPEFVLWDTDQEFYPFIFETIGDWSITTSVNLPEGFKADYKSLDADVRSEMEAIQFTITDVGSKWEETEVTHKIKHKGKTEVIKSKIGVKLSNGLAKKKGLGPYGHTETPGPFKGGRKVGQKQE
jgi:hypothetical protein